MAIKIFTANLNGGDETTSNENLIFKIYGNSDNYSSPIVTTGSSVNDSNVVVNLDSVTISNVEIDVSTEFKITAIDEAGNESEFSDAFSIAINDQLPYIEDSVIYFDRSYDSDIVTDVNGRVVSWANRVDSLNPAINNLDNGTAPDDDDVNKYIIFEEGNGMTYSDVIISKGATTATYVVDTTDSIGNLTNGSLTLSNPSGSLLLFGLGFSDTFSASAGKSTPSNSSVVFSNSSWESGLFVGKIIITFTIDSANGVAKMYAMTNSPSGNVMHNKSITVDTPITEALDMLQISDNDLLIIKAIDFKNSVLTESKVKEVQNYLNEKHNYNLTPWS